MTVLNRRTDDCSAAIYIGRGSPWGNPFVLNARDAGKPIRTMGWNWTTVHVPDRNEAIDRYREALWQSIQGGLVHPARLAELNGADLACWCKPEPCHGDVLMRAIAWAVVHTATN